MGKLVVVNKKRGREKYLWLCIPYFHTRLHTRPYIRVSLCSMRMNLWRKIHGFVDRAGVRHSLIAMCQLLQHKF
jgi:hypothetical protein